MKKTIGLIVALIVLIGALMPTAFGASANAVDADEEDRITTTTTAVACYATQAQYDNTVLKIGETRTVRVYHPATGTASGIMVSETSENITVTYDAADDVVYVTALAAGEATLYVQESNCSFGTYVYLTVSEEGTMNTDGCGPMLGDVDGDGILTTIDARLVLQYTLGDVTYLAESGEYLLDFNDDAAITTADARDILIATL